MSTKEFKILLYTLLLADLSEHAAGKNFSQNSENMIIMVILCKLDQAYDYNNSTMKIGLSIVY